VADVSNNQSESTPGRRMQEMGKRMAASGSLHSMALALPGTTWRIMQSEAAQRAKAEYDAFDESMRRAAAVFASGSDALERLRWALQRPQRERRQVAAMQAWSRRKGRRK
jgi:hypothetical protein